jgi:ferritin
MRCDLGLHETFCPTSRLTAELFCLFHQQRTSNPSYQAVTMKSKKVQDALNKQINEELYSAYAYLGLAAEADRLGLPGFVNWFKLQYNEELAHADRFFNYILERDGEIQLEPIGRPEVSNETALSLFTKALKHEEHITQCIFNLKDLARAESDHATDVFLEWFVTEQVEEEANARAVIDQLKMIDGNPNGLFMVDRELAGRQPEAAE